MSTSHPFQHTSPPLSLLQEQWGPLLYKSHIFPFSSYF
nr:MAG TPA: hypothetical protein [Caudoviricetes sp.]DAS48856.1 MAG TPA: hypothetical protein [Caudoviricetes sp.]